MRATRSSVWARYGVTRFDRLWEPLFVVAVFCVVFIGTWS
jgi:hypothetical protein